MIENKFVELIHKLEDIDNKLSNQKLVKKAILLMGQSKVGKTTLMYYLLGQPLVHIKNEMDVYVLQSQSLYKEAHIGMDYNSTTLCPNFSSEDENGIIVIDMPGFGDSKQENLLFKLYIFRKISKIVQNIHICLIISEEEFDTNHLMKEFEKINHFFNPIILEGDRLFSFVFAKVEDEQIVEHFQEAIQDLKQENEVHLPTHQLQSFKQKKKYIFKNDQPDPHEGIQLRQLIVSENQFINVHKNKNFLSQNYIKAVVGDLHKEAFLFQTHLLIKEISQASIELVTLSVAIIFYEYSSIIADMLEVDEQKFEEDQKKKIQFHHSSLFCERNQKDLIFTQQKKKQALNENLQFLHSIFHKQDETSKQIPLAYIFSEKHEKRFEKLTQNFITRIQNTFNYIADLLYIFSLFKDQQLENEIRSFQTNSKIQEISSNFYMTWFTNLQKLKTQAKYQLIMKQNSRFTSSSVVKVPQFQNIRKNKVYQMIKNTEQSIPRQKQQQQKDSSYVNNDCQVFSDLIQEIKTQQNQPEVMKKSILQIMNIFYRFSLFQEALVFAMSIRNHNALIQLLEEGIISAQLTKEFITDIMIKYLGSLESVQMQQICLQLCRNYLFSQAVNHKQLLKFQEECLRQAKNLKQNIESELQRSESYLQIKFDFIRPIIEEKEYYQHLLQQKQAKFKNSLSYRMFQQHLLQDLDPDGCI